MTLLKTHGMVAPSTKLIKEKSFLNRMVFFASEDLCIWEQWSYLTEVLPDKTLLTASDKEMRLNRICPLRNTFPQWARRSKRSPTKGFKVGFFFNGLLNVVLLLPL